MISLGMRIFDGMAATYCVLKLQSNRVPFLYI